MRFDFCRQSHESKRIFLLINLLHNSVHSTRVTAQFVLCLKITHDTQPSLPCPLIPLSFTLPPPPQSVALAGWLMVRLRLYCKCGGELPWKLCETSNPLTSRGATNLQHTELMRIAPRLEGLSPPLVGCVAKGPGKVVISPFLKSTGFDKGQTITVIIHPSFRPSVARIESCRSEIIFSCFGKGATEG